MNTTVVHSSEACDLIGRLEELLEARIASIVAADASGDLMFVFPAGLDDRDVQVLLTCIGSACQNALKSL